MKNNNYKIKTLENAIETGIKLKNMGVNTSLMVKPGNYSTKAISSILDNDFYTT